MCWAGALCLLWAGLWLFFSSNTPEQHGRITELERRYILTSLKSVAQSDENKVGTVCS